MEQQWREVLGYEGLYEVSNFGKVRSVWSSNGARILKPGVTKKHCYVYLRKDGVNKKSYVHRLVLTAFSRQPETGEECSHIDGNSRNNRLDNLCWESHKKNMSRDFDHGKRSWSKLNPEDVVFIRKAMLSGVSQTNLAKMFKVHSSSICAIKIGKSWTQVTLPSVEEGVL